MDGWMDGCARDPAAGPAGGRRRENRMEFHIEYYFAVVAPRFASSLSRHVSTAHARSAEQEMDGSIVCVEGFCAVTSFLQVNKRSECGGARVHVERSLRATRSYRVLVPASSSTIIVVVERI